MLARVRVTVLHVQGGDKQQDSISDSRAGSRNQPAGAVLQLGRP